MTEDDARLMLVSRGWLAMQPPHFQQAVFSQGSFRTWNDGETIYDIGVPPDGIYGLASGGLSLFIAPHRPGPFFAHVPRPGFWVGESAHITDTLRRVGLTARGHVTMFHLPPRGLANLCASDPTAAWKIAAIVVSHLDLAISIVSSLMVREPMQKVAGFLLTLTGWNCAPAPPWDSIEITQSELADICQLSRKTVVNVIAKLHDLGAIRHTHKMISILDRGLLSRLTEER